MGQQYIVTGQGFKGFEFYTGVVNITDWENLLVIARLLE